MVEEGIAQGPMSRATVSTSLIATLREHYALNLGKHVRDLGGGNTLNLLVSDGQLRYVARVYRPWVTPARLNAIQQVRRLLKGEGIPCVEPVQAQGGASWTVFEHRLVELEPYVDWTAAMDSLPRLEAGLPLLGRIHTILSASEADAAGREPLWANHLASDNVVSGVRRGTARVRGWFEPAWEHEFIGMSNEVASLVAEGERGLHDLPKQLVHGDFWDNNVLFRDGRIVLVADLDFMGERPRIDDLALTLYYTNSTFADGRDSATRRSQLRTLVDAYDRGLDTPLTAHERAAIPLAIARSALCFVAMIADADSEDVGRTLAREMAPDIAWAGDILRELDAWQAAMA